MVLIAQVGEPVPAKHAFDTDNDILQERKNKFKKQFGVGIDVFVYFGFAFAIEDAYIHFTSMQIDPAVVLVLLFVKSHRLASFRFGKCSLVVTISYRCE